MIQQHKAARKHITIRLDYDTLDAIGQICDDLKVDRSLLIRAIIAQFVRMITDKDGNIKSDLVLQIMLFGAGEKERRVPQHQPRDELVGHEDKTETEPESEPEPMTCFISYQKRNIDRNCW